MAMLAENADFIQRFPVFVLFEYVTEGGINRKNTNLCFVESCPIT
jgi:hypothetical protein